MKTYKLARIIPLGTFLLVMLFSFSLIDQQKPWVVPDASQKLKSQMKNTPENISLGKGLYAKHCKSCHGKDGEGDGPKAAELKTTPGDFTSAEFQSQTDGALFYKTTEGREDMPTFKKKIASEEDRWLIVAYLRTLKR